MHNRGNEKANTAGDIPAASAFLFSRFISLNLPIPLVRSCYPHAVVTLCIWRSYILFHTAIPVVLYFISCISGYLQFANRTASTGRLYDAHRAHTLSSFIVTSNPRICMMFLPALLIYAHNIRKMHLLFPVLYPLLRMHIVQRCQITACYFLLVFLTSSLAYIYLFS